MSYFKSFGADEFAPLPDFKVTEEVSSKSASVTTEGGESVPVNPDTGAALSSSLVTGDYIKSKGITFATNERALERLKDLQRSANRVAKVKGLVGIIPDGKIGPKTLALLSAVQGTLKQFPSPAPSFVSNLAKFSVGDTYIVAKNSALLTDYINQVADAFSAPATVPTPPPSTPPVIVQAGADLSKPATFKQQGMGASFFDMFARMSTIQKAGLAAGLAGLGFFAYRTFKK